MKKRVYIQLSLPILRFSYLFVSSTTSCPVFLLAVVDEGTVPAVGAADGGDDFLIFGRDKAEAFAHLEVDAICKILIEAITL